MRFRVQIIKLLIMHYSAFPGTFCRLDSNIVPSTFFFNTPKHFHISVFHRAFFNSVIDKHQHMHFFTFNTILV